MCIHPPTSTHTHTHIPKQIRRKKNRKPGKLLRFFWWGDKMAILWRPTLQRLLQWAEAGFDTLVSVAGPFFIILAVVLIGGCAYLYFSAIVPYLFPEWTVLALLNMLVSVWIVANMTFNYFTCVFTKPGSPALTNVGIMALFFSILKSNLSLRPLLPPSPLIGLEPIHLGGTRYRICGKGNQDMQNL